jgi:membrane-associated phospholipid phosphatase
MAAAAIGRTLAAAIGRTLALAPALLLCAGAVSAQSLPRKVWNDVRWAAEDAFFLTTSPVRADAGDWKTVGWVALATGAAFVVDDEVDRWIARNPSSLPLEVIDPFTEGHDTKLVDLGSGALMVQASGVLYLAGVVFDSQDLRDAGIGCAVAEKMQSAVRHGVYKLVARERPLTADGDPFLIGVPGGDWEKHSFFGGHGANIMTCAAFWTERFDLSYAEPLIMGAALGVNIGRVVDRRHWLSDALVGAVFGYAMGKGMADRQRGRVGERAGSHEASERSPWSGLYADRIGDAFVLGWKASF